MEYARVLEGLPRNPGTHAAGVVIGEKPLIEIVPLARDKDKEVDHPVRDGAARRGRACSRWTSSGCKTLTVIQEAVDHVRANARRRAGHGRACRWTTRPTFDLLNRGDTVGVFQLESEGMRDLLRRIGADPVRGPHRHDRPLPARAR